MHGNTPDSSICRTNLGLQTCRWMSQTYSPEYCPATQHSSSLSASPWPCSDPPDTGTPATPAGLALAFIRTLMSTRLPLQWWYAWVTSGTCSRPVPLSLKVVPSNLLTALWLQLGAAMEGDGRYQRCPQCQHWFQVPAKAKRASTTYCSPRCRIRAYRERHEQTQGTRGPATTLDRASDPRLGKTGSTTWDLINEAKPSKPRSSTLDAANQSKFAKGRSPTAKNPRKPRSSTNPHAPSGSPRIAQDPSERSRE